MIWLLVSLLVSGCSFSRDSSVEIQIALPPRDSLRPSASFLAPATLDDFECIAIKVVGPNLPTGCAATISSILAGPGETTLRLKVPAGPSRTILVFGMDRAAGCPINQTLRDFEASFPLGTARDYELYEIGNRTLDLFRDTATEIALSYNSASPIQIPPCVNTGASGRLVFRPPTPSIATTGTAFAPAPDVEVQDANGNPLSGWNQRVKLQAFSNATCTTLATGVLQTSTFSPVLPTGSIAGFAGVTYTRPGTIYLKASSAGLAPACSGPITVSNGANEQLVATISAPSGNCFPLHLERLDLAGTLIVGGLMANVGVSPVAGASFYSNSSCTTAVGTFIGSSPSDIYVRPDVAGEITVDFSASIGCAPACTTGYVHLLGP